MAEQHNIHSSDNVTSEACAWIAQLETGDLSVQDMNAFREWIRRSPRHYNEIKKLAQLSSDLNILTELAAPLQQATQEQKSFMGRSARPGLFNLKGIMVMSTALFCFLGLTFFGERFLHVEETYMLTTEVGEQRDAELSDGSVIKLNTASQVEVDFDRKQRRIRLLQGEAFFKVAHNVDRPFVVYVGDKAVKAVGTAFAVRWTEGNLSVTVSEGKVEFAPAVPSPKGIAVQHLSYQEPEQEQATQASVKKPLLIKAKQILSLPSNQVAQIELDVPERKLLQEMSWQSGILDFVQQPLKDIVAEMSRYSNLQVEIDDPELRELKFGGVFRIGETEALFDALQLAFDVEVERVNDNLVRLKRSQS